MTRKKMAESIERRLGTSEIKGIEHIDRPTWWLRQMAAELGIIEHPYRDSSQEAEKLASRQAGKPAS